MNCQYCGTPLEGKRDGAKFCSASHRKMYHKRHQSEVTDKRQQHEVLADSVTLTAWFDNRRGSASLTRDYADLRAALRNYDRDALIQEIIAYRADLDELRAVLKIVAPKTQTTQGSRHHGTRTHIF